MTFDSMLNKAKQKLVTTQQQLIGLPAAAYCIFAGLNALQTGHTYMALKYLEARIAAQGTGIVAIFLGSLYYNKKDKRELITQQPFGPYKHGYGKTHHTKSNLESVMGY